MNVEIICVGTELLLGDILNTNARYLSQQLAEMGFNLFSQSVVGDNAERLEKQLTTSMARSEIVILTGGLGPTADDITKETTARVLNLPLEMHKESMQRIKDYFDRTGRQMSESNKKQALTIVGSIVLKNDNGTAPGYFVKTKKGAVILLPGPPSELKPMFEDSVIPLLKTYGTGIILSHNIKVFGIGESLVAEKLGDMLTNSNPTVATYAKTGEVDIRVTAKADDVRKADEIILPFVENIKNIFGSNIYGIDVDSLQQKVVDLLIKTGKKIATAESCTAGMLSGRITEIPGSSEVFEMGVTAYANYIKEQALGVDPELIERRGAVCDEVAAQMAVGIRTMCNADLGIGITGVAGPGESEGKPAGLVYIALADGTNVFVRKILARGSNRENTRILATSTALDMVRRYLEGYDDIILNGTKIGEPLKVMEGYSLSNFNYKFAPVIATPKEKTAQAPKVIYNDKELMDMFKAVDSTNEDEPVENEKLDIKDESMGFVFEDDYYILGERSNVAITKDEKADNTEPEQKRNILKLFIPWKNDPIGEIIRKIIFLVAFVVLICTTTYLISYFAEGVKQTGITTKASQVWKKPDSMQKNNAGIYIGFEELKKANADIKAWIKIDGTNINNPVYQTDDNDFYVDHNMNKQSSRYGALFIDKANVISDDEVSQNTIIYGHHMRDGTMFGPLKKYTDLDFYKEHPIIDFTTLYKQGKYKIFSVFITNTLEEHDENGVFNYRRTKFQSDEDFLNFVNDIKVRSMIDTGVEVLASDEILTLSTCTYEFDDARLVVVARRVRDYEMPEEYNNTATAKVNPKPLYPDIWYNKKGLKKPNFDDVLSSLAAQTTSSEEQISSDETVSDGAESSNSDVDSSASSDDSSSDVMTNADFNSSQIESQKEESSSSSSDVSSVEETSSEISSTEDLTSEEQSSIN